MRPGLSVFLRVSAGTRVLTHSLEWGCDQPRRDGQCQGCETGAGAGGPAGGRGGFLRLPQGSGGRGRLGAHPFVVSRASWRRGWGVQSAVGQQGATVCRTEENRPHSLWRVEPQARPSLRKQGEKMPGLRGRGGGAEGLWGWSLRDLDDSQSWIGEPAHSPHGSSRLRFSPSRAQARLPPGAARRARLPERERPRDRTPGERRGPLEPEGQSLEGAGAARRGSRFRPRPPSASAGTRPRPQVRRRRPLEARARRAALARARAAETGPGARTAFLGGRAPGVGAAARSAC